MQYGNGEQNKSALLSKPESLEKSLNVTGVRVRLLSYTFNSESTKFVKASSLILRSQGLPFRIKKLYLRSITVVSYTTRELYRWKHLPYWILQTKHKRLYKSLDAGRNRRGGVLARQNELGSFLHLYLILLDSVIYGKYLQLF